MSSVLERNIYCHEHLYSILKRINQNISILQYSSVEQWKMIIKFEFILFLIIFHLLYYTELFTYLITYLFIHSFIHVFHIYFHSIIIY